MAEEATYVGPEEEYAPFWTPTPGETISGKMVSVHVMQGDYGPTPVVTIENGDGRHAIMVRGTVFREEMAQRHPKPGDDLAVTYLGTKAPKSGRGKPYHVYRVQGGTEPEFDWGQFVDSGRQGWESQPPGEPPISPAAVPAPKPTPPAPAGEQFGDEPPF